MNSMAKNLITESLNRNGKNVLKKFECNKCGQIYIYIVKVDTQEVNCNVCKTKMILQGD